MSQHTHTQNEEWRPIPGYEGNYSVSNLGNVRSEKRVITDRNGNQRRMPELIMKPEKKRSGHLVVCLWKSHKKDRRYIHRLVLEAFVGIAPSGLQACHVNDDPEDNRLANLRWGTPHQNMLDRVRNGKHPGSNKTHCKWGHEFTEENIIPQSGHRGRQCRTCANAWHRAKRRNMTLKEYFKSTGWGQ